MPRTARASLGNWCYHVLNRGNGRAEVFHKPEDYAAFIDLFAPACERISMRLLGWCLMPNHFHLVLWPRKDGDLGRRMHVLRYVERNALRAGLAPSAHDWLWGSLRVRIARGGSDLLSAPPVPLPKDWARLVNEPQTEAEVAAIRGSIARGRPFGNSTWTRLASTKLGLESSLRPRGRPKKDAKK